MSAAQYLVLDPGAARARRASDLVMAGNLGFINGVLPVDLGNERVALAEFVEDQALKVLANLEAILGPHGMNRDHVVSVRIHLTQFDRFHERVTQACDGFFAPGRLPTISLVGIERLPRGALVGMDFVVYKP